MMTIGNIKGVKKEHQITVFRASDNLPYLQFVLSDEAVAALTTKGWNIYV